jgi:hypothetical protein
MLLTRGKIVLLAAIFLGGCQSQPVLSADQLRPATDLAGVLLNIKLATQTGLILRNDFYHEGNLKRVFGPKSVTYQTPSSSRDIVVDLNDFPESLMRFGKEGTPYSAFTFSVRRYLTVNDELGAVVSLRTVGASTPKVDLYAIERLIGNGWSAIPPPTTGHEPPGWRNEPQRIVGITYNLWRGTPSRTIDFVFHWDGSLESIEAKAGSLPRIPY